jgi:hypothetical protein
LILLGSSLVAPLAVGLIRNRGCPGWAVANVATANLVDVASLVGSAAVYLVIGAAVCVWVKRSGAFVTAVAVVMLVVAAAELEGGPSGSCMFSQSMSGPASAEAKAGFVQACEASAATTLPTSGWAPAARVQMCSCVAPEVLKALTAEDAEELASRGQLDAKETMRVWAGPMRDCLRAMAEQQKEGTSVRLGGQN